MDPSALQGFSLQYYPESDALGFSFVTQTDGPFQGYVYGDSINELSERLQDAVAARYRHEGTQCSVSITCRDTATLGLFGEDLQD